MDWQAPHSVMLPTPLNGPLRELVAPPEKSTVESAPNIPFIEEFVPNTT